MLLKLIYCSLLIFIAVPAMGGNGVSPSRNPPFGQQLASIFSREVREIEAHRDELTRELAPLPVPPGISTSVRLGWHSKNLRSPDDVVWAQVDLGGSWPLDAVVLVPASGLTETQGGPGYGFPSRFRLEMAEDAEFKAPLALGDFTKADVPNPGAFPFVVKLAGQQVRHVRMVATKAWPRREDWIVALGELVVLSAGRNVAAGAVVQTSSSSESLPAWAVENLTDGQSVLGPPVNLEPSPSNGYLGVHETPPTNVIKWVQVDLGSVCPIEEVRLFPARPTDFADSPGSGFPVRFRVDAASDASFAMPQVIFDTKGHDFINPGENVVTFRSDGKSARYVRVTATQLHDRGQKSSFALAELQVWSRGTNLALGAPVSAFDIYDDPKFPRWRPEYLVDGFTSRHRILDLPVWLSGLQRRREIEQELVRLDAARSLAVDATLALVARVGAASMSAVVLLAGALLWRARTTKRRAVEGLRIRIASDLHDDIGSQLGSIALAAQLAARTTHDPNTARERLAEIERIARETSEAMHDLVWLLKPGNANLTELVSRLRDTSAVQLRELDYEFKGDDNLPAKPVGIEFARNVYLLFKEALSNVVKHARAKTVGIALGVRNGNLQVTIRDDGAGFDTTKSVAGDGLANMRRRAVQIGATLEITSSPGLGTAITLAAPIR